MKETQPPELHQETAQTIRAQRQELAEAIVARQYQLQPELWLPYGEPGRQKGVRDAGYHLSYLVEAINTADPSLFVDYITWIKVLFAGLNFSDEVLVTTLECIRDILAEKLSPETFAVATDYLEAGLNQIRTGPTTLPTFLPQEGPFSELARQYFDALLEGKRHLATRLILEAVEAGTPVKDIYLSVFQPCQHEIGRLWQINQVSVAQEHYVTAATQLIMSQLYPYIFATEKTGRRLVATCIGGELHEIGIRMVTDFFEMEGWDTYYLGANTPTESIVQTVVDRQADVLAISATITFHVSAVAALIDRVRAADTGQEVKILVGGYPFNVSPQLWKRVQADGCAPDAQEAILLANRLVEQGV